ncbi:MAG: restriction endonuclease subunit S [Sutterella sp.]|nr:restriction endonuclease subunit S [Sutterella sp.]
MKKSKLRDVADIQTGPFGSQLHKEDYVKVGTPIVTVEHLGNRLFTQQNLPRVSEFDKKRLQKYLLEEGDIVFSRVGSVDRCSYVDKEHVGWLFSGRCLRIRPSLSLEPLYLYYFLSLEATKKFIKSIAVGATMPSINTKILGEVEIPLPSIDVQKSISYQLSLIDRKIEVNNKINDNLQQQVMTLYRQMFVENTNDVRRECRADEYFDISIGKTPPRKEPQWFSENPVDHVWVSISDMGSCGLFIAKSSEYLTHEAVERFNVKVVPDNTVLLSFKLTVGRIAITDGEMTTNEAIAHFKTNKQTGINEYLFCYLKNFNYQTMDSTSSIATAVNSKIIKGMPFVVPTDDELEAFHGFAEPIFAMIKRNQRENTLLTTLRNTLLVKLMSGEIDVSGIQL